MSFTSRTSGIADLPAPVAVCCHDAGGANLIAAWIAANSARDYRLHVAGPAAEIFSCQVPGLSQVSLDRALEGAACLLSGSGWASDLEHVARMAARQRGISVITALDHWVNYRSRFVRQGREELPDAFIVVDSAARDIAMEAFGSQRPIALWHNNYLDAQVAEVEAISSHEAAVPPVRLLVVLEPVRQAWSTQARQPGEFQALDYLRSNLGRLSAQPERLRIRLRPHPSESDAKYAGWISQQPESQWALAEKASLAADIAWADAVAGLNSYALVVAKAANRRAISYLPPEAPPCVVRYPGIEFLGDLTT